jgi:hypothetical protein
MDYAGNASIAHNDLAGFFPVGHANWRG